jgi:hypothetical protein
MRTGGKVGGRAAIVKDMMMREAERQGGERDRGTEKRERDRGTEKRERDKRDEREREVREMREMRER